MARTTALATREHEGERRPETRPAERFSRAQKAAAVLLAVGSEAAAGVLQHMNEAEIEVVAYEVATLGELQRAQLEPILEEFHAEALAHQHYVTGGEDFARDMLRRLKGADADEIIDRVLATVNAAPFSFLRQHEPRELAQQLRDEHPQTVALILAHLSPKFAAQVVTDLDSDAQAEVSMRLALLDRTSPEVIRRVESALQQRLGALAREGDAEVGGVKELANVLNQSDRHTEQTILSKLEEHDPELAEQVRQLMFVFEDIVLLADRAVQEVLRQVDMKQVAIALKGVGEEVRDHIQRNLSERARETLAEEIELLGPVRVRDVEQAQTEVVRTIRRLEEEGAIEITRGDDGEFVE